MADDTSEADLSLRETFPFWSTEKIRFGDLDRQNHVNNLAVCSYIESGRVEFREREFPEYARDQSISWLVVNFEIAFKAVIGYPGTVDVGTGILKIGKSSYVLGHGAFTGDLCIATAKTITVFGDRATEKSRPIPDDLRAHFERLRVKI